MSRCTAAGAAAGRPRPRRRRKLNDHGAHPVPVPCVDTAPDRPALVTGVELRAMSDYQLVLALHRDRLMRILYESEFEATLTRAPPVDQPGNPMKLPAGGYGELRRGNDLISRHTVPEEAYERASAEGEGTLQLSSAVDRDRGAEGR